MIECILTTEYDCLVEIGVARFELMHISPKLIKIENEKEFLLKIFPISNKNDYCSSVVYQIKILPNIIKCENTSVLITKYDNWKYELFLKASPHFCQNELLTKKQLGNKIAKVFSNGNFIIESSTELLFKHSINELINEAEVYEINGHFVLLYETISENKICVFNAEQELVLTELANQVELTENGFKTLHIKNDYLCQGVVKEYVAENNNLKLLNEFCVYLNNSPARTPKENNLAICFLQCIKSKNYDYAKNMLSDNLRQNVSEEHFYAFFKDFVKIEPNYFIENKNELYLTMKTDIDNFFVANKYSFVINNNKIENIVPQ